MKPNLKIQKGEVIVTTTGEYSNFGIDGFIVALQDFDMAAEAKICVEIRKATDEYDQYEDFTAFLITKELVIPVKYREIHLGSYSRFDDDFGVPKED